MTFEQNSALPKRFVTSTLPWLVGLVATVVYLATMNHWATVNSVGIVSRVSGWLWQPDLHQPLVFLLLYPFRFLPEHLIPMALNVFNAVLAGLVVTLLARSVALLPHDRTSDQRELAGEEHGLLATRTAWIPPVLAAVVLGLQISFWENATAVSGEIIDVLVVAYVIRCLLEFRLDERQSWMSRAAFVYAAGMTNNWALIGLLPVFLATVVWIKGLSFFNARFIGRMTLWALCGLSLYLLLPLVQSFASAAPVDFWTGLKVNLGSQKNTLAGVYAYFKDNYRFVVVGATSLLPLFFIALKWRSSFGDTSPIGIFITKSVFHIVHGVFFVVCLLVVLSPPYSPRQLLPGVPFLNHTFLAALVVGYCAGYFLLICGPALRSRARMNSLIRLIGYAGWAAVIGALIIMPAALVGRNLEPVKLTNAGLLDDFMARTVENIPKENSTIVCDDPGRLALTRVYLLRQGRAKDHLFYDTQSGKWSDYHAVQRKSQGERWPAAFATLTNRVEISPVGLLAFFAELVAARPMYYLEPSFGYYFERFELTPRGLVYAVAPYATNALLQTPLSAETVSLNENFWSEFDEEALPALRKWIYPEKKRKRPTWLATLYKKLHLSDERVLTAAAIGRYSSRASTYWGAEQQKIGHWEKAAGDFERSLTLNPDNVVAEINLTYNAARQTGEPAPTVAASIEDQFGRYNDWNEVMGACGPFDEPRFTFEQGRTFFSGRLYRQSLQSIKRVTELQPHHYVAHIWLADLYTMLGKPGESLEIVENIRANPSVFELNQTRELDLARVEATALFRTDQKEKAQGLLEKALDMPEVGMGFRAVAAQLFLQAGLNAEALPLLQQVVDENPTDVRSLANLGYASLQLEKYEQAKESLTRALELDPKNNVVRLNRAITLLRAKEYDAAREDYLMLQQEFPKAYQVQFGLGEIALARNDQAAAIEHFERSLNLTPVGTPDYLHVSNRLATVRAEIK